MNASDAIAPTTEPAAQSESKFSQRLLVYGAGGHGLVVALSAEQAGWQVVGFADTFRSPGETVERWPVLGDREAVENTDAAVIVAIGDNATRAQLIDWLVELGKPLATVIHPKAVVSNSATVGDGVFVGPQAVVHGAARVRRGCIINTSAVVEHHCRINRYVHVAPGAVLCGTCQVGPLSFIGANATVLPHVTIGQKTTIGAGSVVTRDVPENVTAFGSPAKVRGES